MAQTPEKDDTLTTAAAPETDTKATDGQADDAAKLSMTQDELDALIEKRLARERKKWEKAGKAAPAAPTSVEAAAAQPGTAPAAAAAPAENANELMAVNRALATARAQLAAITAGVRPDMAEDAVCLALKDAEKDGEADEEDIAEALKAVMKRHPEWKQSAADEKKGGFKLGADAAGTIDRAFFEKAKAEATAKPLNSMPKDAYRATTVSVFFVCLIICLFCHCYIVRKASGNFRGWFCRPCSTE